MQGKKIKIGDIEYGCLINGFILKDINDLSGTSIISNTFENPILNGLGVNKVRNNEKKLKIVLSLRKNHSYELSNAIYELKKNNIGKITTLTIYKNKTDSTLYELSGDIIINNISVIEKSAGTFADITIDATLLKGYFIDNDPKELLVQHLTTPGTTSNFIIGNYEVLPIIKIKINNSNVNQIKLEYDNYYVINKPENIVSGDTIIFDFKKGRVYKEDSASVITEIDSNGEMIPMNPLTKIYHNYWKDNVLATGIDVDYYIHYYPTYI